MTSRRLLVLAALGVAFLALAAIGAAAAWRLTRVEEPPPPRIPPPQTAIGWGPVPRTAVYGREFFGINEAISVAAEASPLGGVRREEATLLRRAIQTRDLGATAIRANSHVYPNLSMMDLEKSRYDWSKADRFFAAARDLDVVVVLGPWPGTRTSTYTDRYVPADLVAYERYVERVVERYDGDGDRDMPGLVRPVLAWEIDNEPDLHNSSAPRSDEPPAAAPREFQTPAQYAAVLRHTAKAIRKADPDALVLSGGIYRPMTPMGRDYLAAVLAEPGASDVIDAVSLHCYFADDDLDAVQRTLLAAREVAPGLPIWITETGVPSDLRKPHADDAWQGRMVAAITGGLLAGGADRMFWHSLADPAVRPPGPAGYSTNSLFRTVRPVEGVAFSSYEEKPAARVFRRLASVMADVDLASVREIPSGGGRVIETDRGWLAFWGTPDVPAGATSAVDLRTGEAIAIGPTVATPAWLPK